MKLEGDGSVKTIIRTLGHRYKWVSASRIQVSVAVGLLGLASMIFAIRDGRIGSLGSLTWPPEGKERSEKLYLVPGLQNLGNNCFLNVILQALASCLCFPTYLHRVIEGCETVEEQAESLQLTIALANLLEDLSTISQGRVVLNPRKVMLAMTQYIPNFNLTNQQDADEAFLHLLSSLREEFSDCYRPSYTSVADFPANCRIIAPKSMEEEHEQERWQQHFLGPFDGVVTSILTCRSCSSQISLEFQFFHSLPLSPANHTGDILARHTLEECLKQFFVAEQLENYRCSHCWHIAAVKYLSSIKENKMEIQKVQNCGEEDSCDCRSLIGLEKLPWSNKYSLTLKQLNIARSPKILCLHLQRASVNAFGEAVKLQGHICFPITLDLFPFVKSVVGVKNSEQALQRGQVKLQHQQPNFSPNLSNKQFDKRMQNCIYGLVGDNIYSRPFASDEFGCTANGLVIQGLPKSGGCSNITCANMDMNSGDKMNVTSQMLPSQSHMYRLVSVVEHFGRDGRGHYTVYRSVQIESHNEDLDEQSESSLVRWFCISDSAVYVVPEKDVLAAEASLLFYERIGD